MFDITKLILKIPNFLTPEECDILIKEHKRKEEEAVLEECQHANTGIVTESTFRAIYLEPRTLEFDLVKTKTKEAVKKYSEYLLSSGCFHKNLAETFKYSHDYRLLKYEKGAKIHPHTDHDSHVYGSITFNLNEDYEGGDFKFFNGNHTVSLAKGDVMLFPADYFWVHEVTPILSGVRYSTNSFLTNIPYPVATYHNDQSRLDEKSFLNQTPKEEVLGPYC